jgi:hypothetical protein
MDVRSEKIFGDGLDARNSEPSLETKVSQKGKTCLQGKRE